MKKLKDYRDEYLALQQGEPTVKVFPEDQSCEACLAAVNQYGWALEYVKNQTEAICLAAVKHTGWALKYVESQTEEICLAAVKHNGWALKYVGERFFN